LFGRNKKQPNLKDLLLDLGKVDSSAKELLYKHYYGYVMAVIIRYTSNPADSEELANDSFMKIFNYAHTFTPPADPAHLEKAFKGWIARIASRTAIDFLNKPRLFIQDIEISENDHPMIIPQQMMNLDVQDILKLISVLPELHRIIFNLYEIEGFSHLEIAQMLGLKENISRAYLTRAKQKLRQLYELENRSYGTY
jgi:RNA polymerase sigma factor (sigma-70 family)